MVGKDSAFPLLQVKNNDLKIARRNERPKNLHC